MATTIETTEYSWGRLTVLERGHQYKAVIHPEHLPVLRDGSGRFTDEQNVTWTVRTTETGLRLTASQSRRFDMTAEQAAGIIG